MKEKKLDVLLWVQLFFVFVSLLMGIYIQVAENYSLLPLSHIILSILLMIIGLREYKRTQSLVAFIAFIIILCISLFVLYTAVMGIVSS